MKTGTNILKRNEKGSSMIAALIGLVLIGVTATSVIGLSTSENASVSNNFQDNQSLYVGQAGIEDAKNKLNNGFLPDVQNKPFGPGDYSVATNPIAQIIRVTSRVGIANKTQTLSFSKKGLTFLGEPENNPPNTSTSSPSNGNFASNCINTDVSGARIEADQLKGVKLTKVCNNIVTLAEVIVDWDTGTCSEPDDPQNTAVSKVTGVQSDYTPFLDPDNANKVLICHVPPGNTENAHTLSVAISGWENGHEAGVGTSSQHNLDYLGPCRDIVTHPPTDPTLLDCVAEFHATEHNHNGTHVDRIALANTTIYDNTQGIGAPAVGANAESTIDTVDFSMSANQSYEFVGPGFAVDFDKNLPSSTYFKMSFIFSDGSQKDSYFIVTPTGTTVVDPPSETTSTSATGTTTTSGGQIKILVAD